MIDLYDPDGYVDGPPHEVFERLRREQPVYRQPMPDGTEYWAVLRHADVVHVARHPTVFSASLGGVVLEDLSEEQLAMMRDMVLAMDPPRHVDYRRNLAPHFKAKVIGGARAADPRHLPRASSTASTRTPRSTSSTTCAPSCRRRSSASSSASPRGLAEDPRAGASRTPAARTPTSRQGSRADDYSAQHRMAMYAIGLAEQRRAEPQEDLATLILAADIDGRPMTEIEFGSFFVQLVTAGNDTTRTMLSSGLLALLQHPDQLAALRADRTLIPGAVEEILRWANPLHYFRRTASEDTTIGGQPIAAGEKVAMIYTSANRDEAVFADPHAFDIRRDPNPHLSFGIAEHFCLGVHLARLEGRIFFEELLDDVRRHRARRSAAPPALEPQQRAQVDAGPPDCSAADQP